MWRLGVSCYRCPSLGSASAIETLNLWFDSSSEHILAGSNIQLVRSETLISRKIPLENRAGFLYTVLQL